MRFSETPPSNLSIALFDSNQAKSQRLHRDPAAAVRANVSPDLPTDVVSEVTANQALADACDGRGAGFEVLFNELAGPVAAFAARQGSDDPDGVANTALFNAYKALATFEGDFSAFRGFVFRVARNQIIDDHRKRERRPKLSELSNEALEPVWDDTGDQLGSREWVTDLLMELTEEQREVVALRVLADLSIEDTAAVMGKPATAIKALQRRAMRKLHKLTGEEVHG